MRTGRTPRSDLRWARPTDFDSFDVSRVASYNIGLHFGTRAAALDRLAYLGRTLDGPRGARTLPCVGGHAGRVTLPCDGVVGADVLGGPLCAFSLADKRLSHDGRETTVIERDRDAAKEVL